MPLPTDHTHDPSLRSWIETANTPGADFSVQNLPFGVFAPGDDEPRIGVAIGDRTLDLHGCVEAGLLDGLAGPAACALCAKSLNDFMGLGRVHWSAVRQRLSALLTGEDGVLRDDAKLQARLLRPIAEVTCMLPSVIGDYTDFYASIDHATNVGSMFRPENPLLPNYRHLPVAYHGRSSSIVPSGTTVRRPMGQTKADDADAPKHAASRLLDYELEMGVMIGPGNAQGEPVTMARVFDHIFGMVIVNDWSARDIQKWEYQPLGPFNAKNFATTISPWVVTLEALAPFRTAGPPRGSDDPTPLGYLQPVEDTAFDITVEVHLASAKMREQGTPPMRVSRGSFDRMYWTIAQMVAHHTVSGCNMRPGDLLATGTISGPTESARGCLLERTWRGRDPLQLPDGSERRFLLDGDEVIITAHCAREGAARIGFGVCRGIVTPAEQTT